MDYKGKKVLVVGMARSGQAVVKALADRGARISICDRKSESDLGGQAGKMREMGAAVYAGAYPEVSGDRFDLVVASPGVPLDVAPFRQAFDQGVPVIGEIELAYQLKSNELEICAVTGTNGKTTTTALLEHIFRNAGRTTAAAGNIGVPLTGIVENFKKGIVALEMSSFQLETIKSFRPRYCAIINITPDHIDRHKTMAGYIEAKAKIFMNQNKGDYCVLNHDDPRVCELAPRCPGRVMFFSNRHILEQGAFLENGIIKIIWDGRLYEIEDLSQIGLRGRHNQENILCAASLAFLAGVEVPVIARALRTFKGVRHRMEEIPTTDGVLYINDSKATNPDSAIKALQSFDQPIVLIAGGRNKGSRFDEFSLEIKARVKHLILLGEARDEIRAEVIKTGFANIHMVEDYPRAVRLAHDLASSGDVVLLSPACASWDMFDNYEQRGDLFCQLVRELTGLI